MSTFQIFTNGEDTLCPNADPVSLAKAINAIEERMERMDGEIAATDKKLLNHVHDTDGMMRPGGYNGDILSAPDLPKHSEGCTCTHRPIAYSPDCPLHGWEKLQPKQGEALVERWLRVYENAAGELIAPSKRGEYQFSYMTEFYKADLRTTPPDADMDEAVETISLLLPLARGYAHTQTYPVKVNYEIIEKADTFLKKHKGEGRKG